MRNHRPASTAAYDELFTCARDVEAEQKRMIAVSATAKPSPNLVACVEVSSHRLATTAVLFSKRENFLFNYFCYSFPSYLFTYLSYLDISSTKKVWMQATRNN